MTRERGDDGFTLIEVLIATMLTAVILTVLVASFLVFIQNTSYSSGRDDNAAGAAVLAAYLNRDLASATDFTPKTFSVPATCTSTPTTLLQLTWTQYASAPPASPPDSDPVAGASYSAAYSLVRDSEATAPGICAIQRTATDGSGTLVLIRNLQAAAFSQSAASNKCGAGTQLTVSLSQYKTSKQADTSPGYVYTGCLKARTNGLP